MVHCGSGGGRRDRPRDMAHHLVLVMPCPTARARHQVPRQNRWSAWRGWCARAGAGALDHLRLVENTASRRAIRLSGSSICSSSVSTQPVASFSGLIQMLAFSFLEYYPFFYIGLLLFLH